MAGFQSKVALLLGLTLFLAGVAPCSANSIFATGGNSIATAQDLTADYPTEIFGSLNGDPNDVAFFLLLVRQPELFSVMTLDPGFFGIQDTVLSLFDAGGNGVFLNDDISGGNTFSCISSIAGLGNPCPTNGAILPIGNYYLAISQSANYPVDGSSNEIFSPLSSTDLATAAPSAGPVAGFDGNSFASPDFDVVNYDIVITGTIPEPGTWFMSAAGLVVFFVWARRRQPVTH